MKKPRKLERWAWSPKGLHPAIARLVARPNLVVSFDRYGATPYEWAHRKPSIVNGAGTSPANSPFGSALHFANPTIASPTDFLTFAASTYPATSATMVPHSIAILWKPDNATDEHFPFATDSTGSGVFLRGGSSGFRVTHGGVLDFAYIGSTLFAASHWYLQLYSYDQVAMNHMVIDLNTGLSASQSVGEVRALTSSNGPRVGIKGSGECLAGSVAGIAWVKGAWTSPEMNMVAQMPTALWSPVQTRSRSVVPVGAAGITGSSSVALGLSGSATATVAIAGASALALLLGGTPAGAVLVQGGSTQSLGLGGAAAASVLIQGTSSQSVGLAGSATGAAVVAATSSQSVGLAGAGTDTVLVTASSSASLGLSGSATGTVSSGVTGTSSLAIALGGSASGSVAIAGASSQALGLAGAASGAVLVFATSSQTVGLAGSASGTIGNTITGSSSLGLGLTGTAAGTVRVVGSSTTSVGLGGSSAATVLVAGASSLTLNLASLASAAVLVRGASASTLALWGTAVGSVGFPAAYVGRFRIRARYEGTLTIRAQYEGDMLIQPRFTGTVIIKPVEEDPG